MLKRDGTASWLRSLPRARVLSASLVGIGSLGADPAIATQEVEPLEQPGAGPTETETEVAPLEEPATAPATEVANPEEPETTLSAEDQAALAALLSADEPVAFDALEPRLDIYGFVDFTYRTPVGKVSPLQPQDASFWVGRFNVYFDGQISKRWRSLAEVRFMYLPHGSQEDPTNLNGFSNNPRINGTATDYDDVDRVIRWGGIRIERAWLEYDAYKYLTVRVGQWLTPYGIWNVDHGSLTIINVTRPFIIGQGWFPERQTGIQAYGNFFAGDVKIGYHLTVSNGRGPIDEYRDLDGNKAIGGRIYAQYRGELGQLTLGASGYRGAFTERPPTGLTVEDGVLVLNEPASYKYQELGYAADLKWEYANLLLQSEFIGSEVAYEESLRPAQTIPSPGPPALIPDQRLYGAYFLLGYRFADWNLMPFAMYQFSHVPVDTYEYAVGLNLRPLPQVALKAEYKYVNIPDTEGAPSIEPIDFLTFQAAWSF